jgi:hypothetical protein
VLDSDKIPNRDIPIEILIPPWYPDIFDPLTLMTSSNETNCPMNTTMTLRDPDFKTVPYDKYPDYFGISDKPYSLVDGAPDVLIN